jgi:EAL domain-containing protein (putative c-di-GMP-specific phosphodiesterase class I)
MTEIENCKKHISQLLKAEQSFDAFLVQVQNLHILISAYGHKQTDELIAKYSQSIKAAAVFRIMTDQVLVITKSLKSTEAKKFEKTLAETAEKTGSKTHLHCTIAHLVITDFDTKPADILSRLYSNLGSNSSLFFEHKKEQKDMIAAEMEVATQVKNAIANNEFTLVYQPIIESKTGKTSHYECLIRIKAPDGTLKSAGSFIHIAEKMGLIETIDVLVLEMVVAKLKADKNIRLTFNISNLTVGNKNWVKRFFDLITPELGARMVIEITETSAARDIRETAYFIATLQDTGCMFALDDFGSGYTSFRQIKALSFDYIKIDGSLVHDIAYNQHNKVLVKSLMEYLKTMNVKTVAEFVENGETAKILMEFGVDYLQGNYFGAASGL